MGERGGRGGEERRGEKVVSGVIVAEGSGVSGEVGRVIKVGLVVRGCYVISRLVTS